nr:hypothetical protein [uncultured Undibacterium sp.]
MSTLPPHELEKLFHSSMTEPRIWKVIKYEFEMSFETGSLEFIFLTFKSELGTLKKLKFIYPSIPQYGSLQISSAFNLYIADMSSLGWSNQIEVGEWEEDRSVLFWAHSVEEVA